MKKIIYPLMLAVITFSCSVDQKEVETQIDLREQLGFTNQELSKETILRIKENTPEIHFKSIDEAKEFVNLTQNFVEEEINFFNKDEIRHKNSSNKKSNQVQIGYNELLLAGCPPPILQEFTPPCEGGGGGGCGTGSVLLSTGNISINLHLNVGFNYNSSNNGITVNNFNSHMTGFVLGVSYDHMSSSYTTTSNTINYTVNGVLNYNIFVEGIGTVYRENITLRGNYNPCTGKGSISVNDGPPKILQDN